MLEDKSEGSEDTKVSSLQSKLTGRATAKDESVHNGNAANSSDTSNEKGTFGGILGGAWGEKNAARRRAKPANGDNRHIAFDVDTAGDDEEREHEDVSGKRKDQHWFKPRAKQFLSKLWHVVWIILGKPSFAWIKPRLNWNDLEPVFRVGLSVSRVREIGG